MQLSVFKHLLALAPLVSFAAQTAGVTYVSSDGQCEIEMFKPDSGQGSFLVIGKGTRFPCKGNTGTLIELTTPTPQGMQKSLGSFYGRDELSYVYSYSEEGGTAFPQIVTFTRTDIKLFFVGYQPVVDGKIALKMLLQRRSEPAVDWHSGIYTAK